MRDLGDSPANGWSFGGEAALSVEARYLEPDLPDELQQAYAQTFDRLRRMFRARGCTPEESADLAQDAAVRAFVHIRRWGVNGTGLDPLLNRIARNLLIDRYRRTTPHIVPLDDAGELQDPDQDPTEEVARRQRTHAVRSAIRGLPVRHQTAITYSLNGLTPEEVGRRMGIGRNAADALLHRARRSLKERLQTAGEGMFGVALGIRVRWDRFLRRSGDAGFDNGATTGFQAGASVAALTVVAVIGGLVITLPPGGGDGESHWTTPAIAVVQSATDSDSVGDVSSVADATPAVARGDADGSSSATAYTLGPTTTTRTPDRVDQTISIDDPTNPSGPPLLRIDHGLYRDEADGPEEGRRCGLFAAACRLTEGRDA